MNQSSQEHLLHLLPKCEDRVPHKYISEKKSFSTVQRCVITPPTFVIPDPRNMMVPPTTDPYPHCLATPTSDYQAHRFTADPRRLAPPTTAPYMVPADAHRMVPDPPRPTGDPYRMIPDPHRPTGDPYRMVPDLHRPLADLHRVPPPNTTARRVPELSSQGAEFIGADAHTGGISCLPHGYLDTQPDPSHHVNLPVQKDEYSRHEGEELAQSQSQEFLAACSDSDLQQQTTRASLYDFEDVLRHRINVHIEDFRLGLQHTLTGEFSDFSSAVQAQQQRPAKCGRYDGDGGCVHMVMGGGGSVGSLESYGQGASVEGSHRVMGDDHTSVDMDSGLSSVDRGMDSSTVDRGMDSSTVNRGMDSSTVDRSVDSGSIDRGVDSGSISRGVHSRANSVDGDALDTVDPVLCSTTESSEASITLDQLINHQLIELQTCASLITSILRRPEYANISPHPLPLHDT